jgi:hypothetical protein
MATSGFFVPLFVPFFVPLLGRFWGMARAFAAGAGCDGTIFEKKYC